MGCEYFVLIDLLGEDEVEFEQLLFLVFVFRGLLFFFFNFVFEIIDLVFEFFGDGSEVDNLYNFYGEIGCLFIVVLLAELHNLVLSLLELLTHFCQFVDQLGCKAALLLG
jgi:hypothetical protein